MKNKRSVGLFGEFHGLLGKLNADLTKLGLSPFNIGDRDLDQPPGIASIICGAADIDEFSDLLDSLQGSQTHLILVSLANSNHPESDLLSYGKLNLPVETMVIESSLPYTIVRVMKADDRPGDQHKISWSQDFENAQTTFENPVPWQDLSQVLVHCINRPEVISKTFTVHATSGEPDDDWNHWFKGINHDPKIALKSQSGMDRGF